jgi:hypothetical protein
LAALLFASFLVWAFSDNVKINMIVNTKRFRIYTRRICANV